MRAELLAQIERPWELGGLNPYQTYYEFGVKVATPFDDLLDRDLFRYLIKGIELNGDVAQNAAFVDIFSQAPEYTERVAGQYALPKADHVPAIIELRWFDKDNSKGSVLMGLGGKNGLRRFRTIVHGFLDG
ncbi:MAG: hypothetical protein KGJ27_07555 [candidate division NC10 bacterium]|nr:hypothetical protein [candidate division NC10 bacterium]